ncbi:DNA topoisomerase I, mitochondrial-like [Tubulanus polymorphus]|uniref:DNA topoisomerase I, mitochondrial-like n=1 Tax=Tubulanus polymorphus TaxID=672921 RepID=UPI003DA58056
MEGETKILTNHVDDNHQLVNGNSSGDGKSRKDGSHHKSGSSSSHKHNSSSSSGGNKQHSGGSSSSKHKSSSSSKDKQRSPSSSSKSKEHSSSSKSSGSGDKSKHSSSSSKSENRSKDSHSKSSSSSGDKHKSDKDKHRDRSEHSSGAVKVKKEPTTVISETISENNVGGGRVVADGDFVVKREKPVVKRESVSPVKMTPIKREADDNDSEDDLPLGQRLAKSEPRKRPKYEEASDDDMPLSARAKKPKSSSKDAKKRKSDSGIQDEKPRKRAKTDTEETPAKGGKKKAKEEEPEKWKWWEEDRSKKNDGTKWKFLEHQGPVFAPLYEPLPKDVHFFYNGKKMRLQPETEEVATFYGRMIDHDYTTKDVFNKNFMKDWRKVMTEEEKQIITDLKKCNFNEINDHFKKLSEQRKNKSKEQKLALKEENAAMVKKYGFCKMDGHTEKIGNFRIEPPGLFRGRGDHPKQGMLKRRVQPEDVIINCSKDAKVPDPPKGHRWKEVRHDNAVTWLACWNENIQGQTKYVMLNASSKLKGEKDWQKYETARKLHKHVDRIRAQYREDWKSKEMRIRQRAVALYFIDKLALRAGNEKDEGESADTVGCCSLRVEHLTLYPEKNGKESVVEFDFLGKDSIRYTNSVPVEKRVYKNLELFMNGKAPGDDLFDRLNTGILNKHLNTLMEGLSAKVFRTFNASKTLQEQLDLLTQEEDTIPAKLLSYNRANRAVAILCNHQRAAPKNFDKQMQNLQDKIDAKNDAIKEAKKNLKVAKSEYKASKTDKNKTNYERKKKQLERLEEQLTKLEVQATDKDENKEIALGTSKLNYLDPRISVGWCKKWDVPIEKIYNKTQRDKFAWAIDMAEADFNF